MKAANQKHRFFFVTGFPSFPVSFSNNVVAMKFVDVDAASKSFRSNIIFEF